MFSPLQCRNGNGVGDSACAAVVDCWAGDVIAVGAPDSMDRAILEVILAGRFFGQFRLYL